MVATLSKSFILRRITLLYVIAEKTENNEPLHDIFFFSCNCTWIYPKHIEYLKHNVVCNLHFEFACKHKNILVHHKTKREHPTANGIVCSHFLKKCLAFHLTTSIFDTHFFLYLSVHRNLVFYWKYNVNSTRCCAHKIMYYFAILPESKTPSFAYLCHKLS